MGNSKSKIDPDALDIRKFSHFSHIHLKEWSRNFKYLFTDGFMKKEDLQRLLKLLFPFGNPDKFTNTLFQTINISQTDCVDFNELLIAFSILSKGSKYEKLRWIFRFYDKDKDGIVSRSEMEESVEDLLAMTVGNSRDKEDAKKIVDDIFYKLENKSGFITFNDFERLSEVKEVKFLN